MNSNTRMVAPTVAQGLGSTAAYAKRTLLAAALLATLGLGTGASANIIDLFTEPADFTTNKVQDITTGGGTCALGTASGNGCFQEYGVGANIIGGYRDLYVEVITQGAGAASTAMYAGSGVLSFSNDAATTGKGTVQWDGNDNSATLDTEGLDGADLINQEGCGAGCNQFVADVLVADLGFGYSITVWDMDGSSSVLTSGTQVAVTSSTLAVFPFAWFNLADGNYVLDGLPFNITHGGNLGPVDFTNIGALQLDLNTTGTVAVDLQLASITKTGVPEPGTLALAGLALAGLASLRRRKST